MSRSAVLSQEGDEDGRATNANEALLQAGEDRGARSLASPAVNAKTFVYLLLPIRGGVFELLVVLSDGASASTGGGEHLVRGPLQKQRGRRRRRRLTFVGTRPEHGLQGEREGQAHGGAARAQGGGGGGGSGGGGKGGKRLGQLGVGGDEGAREQYQGLNRNNRDWERLRRGLDEVSWTGVSFHTFFLAWLRMRRRRRHLSKGLAKAMGVVVTGC